MDLRNLRQPTAQAPVIAFCVEAVLLASACTSTLPHTAPKLPPDQAAMLRSGYAVDGYHKARLTAIDGQEVTNAQGSIVLSPGRHRLKLFVSAAATTIVFGEAEVVFEAKPGRVYKIHGKIRYGTARVWVIDEQNNLVVSRGSEKIANTGGP